VLPIPSDTEVFALSLYAFWWAEILLLLALPGNEKKPNTSLSGLPA
jgi:hypothetical protein